MGMDKAGNIASAFLNHMTLKITPDFLLKLNQSLYKELKDVI